MSKALVVTAWHRLEQRDKFLAAWGIRHDDERLVLQEDIGRRGCGFTKRQGIDEAIDRGAGIIILLDDDCFPNRALRNRITGIEPDMLDTFIYAHAAALEPVEVEMFKAVTNPPSRGTPYYNRTVKMPVAASLGFWENVPDYCAPAQLVRGPLCPMEFDRRPIFGQAFPYCGMNVAFRVDFLPWAYLIDLPRIDDIVAGFLFQKEAYRRGYCFNLGGPDVWHERQSNVFKNLKDEANYIERLETLWSDILFHPSNDYEELLKLIPARV